MSVWHQYTLKEPAEPGGHGDVGIAGRDVGDAGREAYLRGRAALLLDSVSLGDLLRSVSFFLQKVLKNEDNERTYSLQNFIWLCLEVLQQAGVETSSLSSELYCLD